MAGEASSALTDRALEELAGYRNDTLRDGVPWTPALRHASPHRTLRFVSAGELVQRRRAPEWVIRGVLEADSLNVLYGAPEVGKSLLALDWLACVATGRDWCGHRVRLGPVLALVGEGHNGYARRLTAWSVHNGHPLAEVPLFVSSMPTALTQDSACADLEAVIGKLAAAHGAPVLIAVDTLARNFGPGDENSTRDMSDAVAACDALRQRWRAAVVLVHHAGKDATKGARGSMVLRAAADAEYCMSRCADLVRFEATKMKEAERPAPLAFRFHPVALGFADDEDDSVTSAVLVPADWECSRGLGRAQPRGKHQRRALTLLRERLAEQRARMDASGRDADQARVSTEAWRELCLADGMERNRFSDAKTALLNAGLVGCEGGFVFPHEV